MISSFINFLRLIYDKRQLILIMAKRDIKSQYIGSSLGLFWTVIHPVVMITVFWFVFSIGFKAKPMNDVPFVVWLTAGMAPWFIFSDIINSSAGLVIGHGHLVKRTIFHPQILPIIKILASLVTHAAFVLILICLILFQGLPLNFFFFFQASYYLICLLIFALGLSWAISALNVFVRDVAQISSVVLQVGFWVTPIFWDIHIMPETVQKLLKLNPIFYVVQGYRDSFISFVPVVRHPLYTLYFWCFAFFVLIGGAMIFRRLRPQFSDIL